MVEDKKSTNTHYVSLEEISRIESEIRSNLRYDSISLTNS